MEFESDAPTASPKPSGGSATSETPLFQKKNKIFRKMESIVALCNQSIADFPSCPTFSGVEDIFSDFKSMASPPMLSNAPASAHAQTKHSKDHRDRKELYIQFLEKKVVELVEHIGFIRRTQENVVKRFYASVVVFAEQLEHERLVVLQKLATANQKPLLGPPESPDWKLVSSFDNRHRGLRKKVLDGTFQTLVNYSVPKLLHYMSNALAYEPGNSASIVPASAQKEINLAKLREEIVGQKVNSDRILFDIAHLRNKIDDQWVRFGHVTKQLLLLGHQVNLPFFQKMLDIEGSDPNVFDCEFLDPKTKGILKYLQPVCL